MMLIVLGLNFVKSEKSFNFVDVAFQYQGLAFTTCELWIFVCSLVVAQKFANLFLNGIIQYVLSSLAFFPHQNVLRYIHVCVYWEFVPFYCCLVFHYMFILQLFHSLLMDILVVSS